MCKRYCKFYHKITLLLIIDLILIFIVLGYVGLFVSTTKERPQWIAGLKYNQPIFEPKPDVKIAVKLISPEEPIIESGDEIKLRIQLINNSNFDFVNPSINLYLQGTGLNYKLNEADLNLPVDKFGKNEIIEKEITISDLNILDQKIPLAVILKVEEASTIRTFVSDPLVIKFVSQVNFLAQSKYYTVEGEQLGMGPLPPKVNTITGYWLFWKVENGYSDLKETKVEAKLPVGVIFTGKTSVTVGAGVEFNPTTNQVIWNLGKIARAITAQAAFEVEIIPTLNQVGQSPQLLTDIKFQAVDVYSDKIIQKTAADLTTALTDLSAGSTFSKVIK